MSVEPGSAMHQDGQGSLSGNRAVTLGSGVLPEPRSRAPLALLGYAIAVLVTLAILALRLLLGSVFGDHASLILFLIPVLLSALCGGVGPGLTATLLGAILGDYFLLEPFGSLYIEDPGDRMRLLVFVSLGVLITSMGEWLHQARRRAELHALEAVASLASLRAVTRQQAAASELGLSALQGLELHALLQQATGLIVEILRVDYASALEFHAKENCLVLRAGAGWQLNLIGHARISVEEGFPAAFTLISREPVVIEDIRTETRFRHPQLLLDHGIVSSASVAIHGEEHPYGVLCAHTVKLRKFTLDEVQFLQNIANVLAAAYQRSHTEEVLRLRDRAIESAMEGVVITDARRPDNPIIYVNAGFERMTGYAEHEVIGRNPRFLQGPDSDPGALQKLREAIYEERECSVELLSYRQDGTPLWIVLSLSPVRDATGQVTHYVGVQSDITERKQIERLKTELISTVSHELRTPLTSIAGALGLLTGSIAGELPEQARQLLAIAQRNSERLTLLLNDILDMDKLESGKMTFNLGPVEMMALAREAMEINQAYAARYSVKLYLAGDVPGIYVHTDPARLMQVLTNLLSNAVKFSPPHETVTLSVKHFDHSVRITIADRGPGIPEDFRSRLFERFAQADVSNSRAEGGTGLGLSISKAIIDRLGGTIGFETAAGKGTVFYVDLPEWREAAQESSATG